MPKTRITWADAQLMPEDGKLYEAIDGDLYVTPAPTLRHQWISANLMAALLKLLVEPGHGWIFAAPTGVEFPDTEEGVQPDIIFIAKDRREALTKPGVCGPPDLVIEIGSPSTANRDRSIKKKLYERQGVPQYWIVDPETDAVEVWDFAVGAQEPARYTGHPPRPPGRPGLRHDRARDRLSAGAVGDEAGSCPVVRISAQQPAALAARPPQPAPAPR